ncbi:MAG: Gfo/Idh/MocA family oxidoreductase [Bryobacteraceae bacterium]
MPDTIKAAFLTVPGGPHQSVYIETLAVNPAIRSASVADPGGSVFPEIQKRWKARLGEVPTYKDYRELLREQKPDLVVVAYPADEAPPVIEAALQAGCHVLAEKPACVRAADFERLNELAKKKDRHLMLAFATRNNPHALKARELVRAGTLGKLYGCSMYFIADQTRLRNPKAHSSWTNSKARSGGGHLIWLGMHYVDVVQFITGTNVAQVGGFISNVGGQPIDVEDSAAVVLEFQGGMLGTLQSGYYLDRSYNSSIRIWGENGWLRMDLMPGQPLEWYSNSEKVVHTVPSALNAPDTYPAFMRAVIDAARGAGPPPVTGTECLQALKAVFGLYQAAGSGRTQKTS